MEETKTEKTEKFAAIYGKAKTEKEPLKVITVRIPASRVLAVKARVHELWGAREGESINSFCIRAIERELALDPEVAKAEARGEVRLTTVSGPIVLGQEN